MKKVEFHILTDSTFFYFEWGIQEYLNIFSVFFWIFGKKGQITKIATTLLTIFFSFSVLKFKFVLALPSRKVVYAGSKSLTAKSLHTPKLIIRRVAGPLQRPFTDIPYSQATWEKTWLLARKRRNDNAISSSYGNISRSANSAKTVFFAGPQSPIKLLS